ncbi:MAG: 4'-phosphopantetheinyl transferase superfamily protein [Klebsiella pneumoniae]|nr:4'-phosphopantetheinyl transferase superfamily protein [Klebsiella pneumoniae]
MRHHRTALPLAGYTIQQIDFDPATFQPEDLFWLPYHASLTGWGRKRQAEHLAGRIAAAYALREVGEKRLPAIGDIERRFTPQLAAELESSIISPAEKTALLRSGLPFPLALTLAFSAKESGFKATPAANQRALGFADFQIVEITASTLALMFAEQRYLLHWIASEEQVITLCALQQ